MHAHFLCHIKALTGAVKFEMSSQRISCQKHKEQFNKGMAHTLHASTRTCKRSTRSHAFTYTHHARTRARAPFSFLSHMPPQSIKQLNIKRDLYRFKQCYEKKRVSMSYFRN